MGLKPESVGFMGFKRGVNNRRRSGRFLSLLLVLLIALLLSGCLRSDLSLQFRGESGGQIIEHLRLSDQVTAVSGGTAKAWFSQIERQTRRLGGKIKRLSSREIEVTIPFGTIADLEAKLDEFLTFSEPKSSGRGAVADLSPPLIQSHLNMKQQNFLLLVRNRLALDLDLRSLGVQSFSGETLLSPEPLFDLTVRLQTPWGSRSVSLPPSTAGAITPPVSQQGQTLAWTLQPGQLNHLEAIFWYPSGLAIGSIVIVLVIAGGFYLRYNRWSPTTGSSEPPPTKQPS